jgi:hypothetical protein
MSSSPKVLEKKGQEILFFTTEAFKVKDSS